MYYQRNNATSFVIIVSNELQKFCIKTGVPVAIVNKHGCHFAVSLFSNLWSLTYLLLFLGYTKTTNLCQNLNSYFNVI